MSCGRHSREWFKAFRFAEARGPYSPGDLFVGVAVKERSLGVKKGYGRESYS